MRLPSGNTTGQGAELPMRAAFRLLIRAWTASGAAGR
jgi:hypothetical protein